MYRKSIFTASFVLLLAAAAMAQEKGAPVADAAKAAAGKAAPASPPLQGMPADLSAVALAKAEALAKAGEGEGVDGDAKAKQLRGMSVLGNNEAPMSLFIVPWKSSELGVETNLSRSLNERDIPVDRDVFTREVEFYEVSVGGKIPAVPAVVSEIGK